MRSHGRRRGHVLWLWRCLLSLTLKLRSRENVPSQSLQFLFTLGAHHSKRTLLPPDLLPIKHHVTVPLNPHLHSVFAQRGGARTLHNLHPISHPSSRCQHFHLQPQRLCDTQVELVSNLLQKTCYLPIRRANKIDAHIDEV